MGVVGYKTVRMGREEMQSAESVNVNLLQGDIVH